MKKIKIYIAPLILIMGLIYFPVTNSTVEANVQEACDTLFPDSEDPCHGDPTNCTCELEFCFDRETGEVIPCSIM